MEKVTFETRPRDPFADEVRLRVAEYFERKSISQHANAAMVQKSIIMLGVTAASYFLILFGPLPPLAKLGLAVMMGVGVAGIGFCVAHDAERRGLAGLKLQ